MAAPTGIVWGDPVYGNSEPSRAGKIGIYRTVTQSSDKQTATLNVQVWFASKYSVSDVNNKFYFDDSATVLSGGATTARTDANIKTTVATGSGWSTSNQVKIYDYSYTYNCSKSGSSTRYLYSKLSGVERVAATMTVTTTCTIPAWTGYAITLNANGGTGSLSGTRTKYHGETYTLPTASSLGLVRTGYDFQGWTTSSTATTVVYADGATIPATTNTALNLYAVWKLKTYTITFNTNGAGTTLGSQTVTHGVSTKISATAVRSSYNFLGWSTSSTATTATYIPGYYYIFTDSMTLYAVWELAYVKPKITGLSLDRCDADGNIKDDGTYALVKFDWECWEETPVDTMYIEWTSATANGGSFEYAAWDYEESRLSGTFNKVIGTNDEFSIDITYSFTITVTDMYGGADSNAGTTVYTTLASSVFPIDIRAGATGIAFGKAAESDGVAEFAYDVKFKDGATYGQKVLWDSEGTPKLMCLDYEIGDDETCESVTLSEPVSKQMNGIILVWSLFQNGVIKNASINTTFVSKHEVALMPEWPHTCLMAINAGFSSVGAKYVYIHDDKIVGHKSNDTSGTNSGISFKNGEFVLRYVIGV